MTKHVIALTYEPKIAPVRDGRCKQTIRVGRRFAVGDSILIHGWAGAPYRSKWSWRLRVVVTQVVDVEFKDSGMQHGATLHPWKSTMMDDIAGLDFIEPPTGEALKSVLTGFGKGDVNGDYQIVRWV